MHTIAKALLLAAVVFTTSESLANNGLMVHGGRTVRVVSLCELLLQPPGRFGVGTAGRVKRVVVDHL